MPSIQRLYRFIECVCMSLIDWVNVLEVQSLIVNHWYLFFFKILCSVKYLHFTLLLPLRPVVSFHTLDEIYEIFAVFLDIFSLWKLHRHTYDLGDDAKQRTVNLQNIAHLRLLSQFVSIFRSIWFRFTEIMPVFNVLQTVKLTLLATLR